MIKQIPITMHPNAFAAFGPDLVTNDVVALMEMIKNSYDAYAYHVGVVFGYDDAGAYIEITDDGVGMTRDTIENVWAVVATPYKRKHPTVKRGNGVRRVSGNKGMGRFSSARLGNKLDIYTRHQDDVYLHVSIDWKSFLDLDSMSPCSIMVEELEENGLSSTTGTRIVISDLKSTWTETDYDELVESLSRIMSPFEEVSDFSINLAIGSYGKKKRDMRRINITPPSFIKYPTYQIRAVVDENGSVEWEYVYRNPRTQKNRNVPGHISWSDVYSAFIKQDVPRSKRADIDETQASCGAFSLEIRAWDLDVDSIRDVADAFDINRSSVRTTLRAYKGISIYRDGVLVLPKSEASRDWIGLDTRRISDIGKRMSTSQMLGIVRIGADSNPEIRDTTDREKLVDTNANIEFCAIIRAVIGQLENLRDMDRERKRKEPSLVDVLSTFSTDKLVSETQEAVASGKTTKDVLKIVQDYGQEARATMDDVRTRLYYYGQVATAGSMSSFILHEIRGGLTSIKRFLRSISKLRSSFDNTTMDYFLIAEKSHERMMLVANSFAPLYSKNFKKQKFSCVFSNEIDMSVSFLNDEVEKNKITITNRIDKQLRIGLHPGEIQTIMVNLLDNAIYWITQSSSSERLITIDMTNIDKDEGHVTIAVSDTGTGVSKENAEKIFEPGVTAKSHGVGMGLVIVAEVLARHQGKIALQIPGELSGATFVFDVPFV